MISVTTKAAEELKSLLEKVKLADKENVIGDDSVLRLVPTDSGQLSLAPDIAREGDHIVDHEGDAVLLVEVELAQAIDGLVLDCEETPQGRKLTVYEAAE